MIFYKRVSFWLILILVSAVLFFALKKRFTSIEVKTQIASRQSIELTVSGIATGTIKSDMEVKVTAQRIGRISRLLVEEGDIVKAGETIAELDSEEAYLSVQIAKASHEKAKALLEEMKTAIEALKVEVETGIQKAEANLKEANKRLKRLKDLKGEGFVSETELDSAELNYDVSKANYDFALSGKDRLNAKKGKIKAQEATIKEAVNQLALAELNYKYSFIKSPISGVVSARPVKLGETVIKGALIATVTKIDSFYIEAFIDEADVGKVKIGQDVHISLDAYPEKTFSGRLYAISPVVLGGKQETRSFEVRSRFKGKDIQVKPGMSADIEIVVSTAGDAIVVPSQAVVEKDGKKHLYVKEGTRARLKEVKIGLFNWTYTQIISGIKEGAEVLINPDTPGLKDSVRIKTSESDH
ncbi:MAG: efflux RND transporter periplasmic adaptor subunit [Nitrospirae bacterium]|nr:efflux RND transporter periplasmic adaptor subunit [Nitrospirota bacterium]